jgi:hypothetical protein
MSNPKIRSNPELFEASWSEFKKVDFTAAPKTEYFQPEDDSEFIPNPRTK